MDGKYLQQAFEIKLACDALSRRIMRWHWEKSPSPNRLRDFIQYLQSRSAAAPEYYLNVGVIDAATSWQKLDTTLCMRVLLDPEAGVSNPKRLLQYALNENVARRACNGLRLARNAAAHATDKGGVVKAIALFDETLDDLEQAYGFTLFAQEELEEYVALVKTATVACGGAKQSAPQQKKTAASNTPTSKKKTREQSGKQNAKAAQNAMPAKEAKPAGVSIELVFAGLATVVFLAAICAQVFG